MVDEAVVVDGNIITSRNPDDVDPFTEAVIKLIENVPDVTAATGQQQLPA